MFCEGKHFITQHSGYNAPLLEIMSDHSLLIIKIKNQLHQRKNAIIFHKDICIIISVTMQIQNL